MASQTESAALADRASTAHRGPTARATLAGGWLSGRLAHGWRLLSTSAARLLAHFDMSRLANQQKLEPVKQLAHLAEEAG